MALTFSTVEGTQLVTVAYSGDIDAEQVQELRKQVEAVVAEQGAVRLLVEYTASGPTPPMSLLGDLKGADFVGRIARAAIVTDSAWIRGMAGTMGNLAPFPVKAFSTDEHGAALEWVTD
jgi:hypothetical protein